MFLSNGKAWRKKASSIFLDAFAFSLITTEYTGAISLVTCDKSSKSIIHIIQSPPCPQ
jgi:phosphatidylinositol kinase/protein kinase (PI-3  family)